jgi:hypothetical protein
MSAFSAGISPLRFRGTSFYMYWPYPKQRKETVSVAIVTELVSATFINGER